MKLKNIDAPKIIESLKEGVVVHNANTEILYANSRALTLLRLSEDQAMGKDALDPKWRFINTAQQPLPLEEYPVNKAITQKGPVSNIEVGICDSSQSKTTWVLCDAYPHMNENNEVEYVVVTFWELAADKFLLPFEAIFANANDVIVITEANTIEKAEGGPKIVYVNQAFTELTGYEPEEVIGKTPRMLQGKETCPETRKRVRNALLNQESVRESIYNYSKSGIGYWLDMNIFPLKNAVGELTHFAAVERDITEQKLMEAELRDIASKDQLTNLLNRRGFYDEVNRVIGLHPIHGTASVAMIDLDHFKRVNDTYGHECGDRALQLVAKKLKASFRGSDLLCRFGGEEFVVVLPNAKLADSQIKLDEFRQMVADSTLKLSDVHTTRITLSIGLTYIDSHTKSFEHALKEADKALYEAKATGRNRTIVFA
ncbi:diguanylate cyclase [Pseudoalteromonas sp. SSDWG2]|uniref:diguanylate cyclase n=1 Tax=Pseudoalteromonas sp. SSDWG2 TaxID=3139391 RepID=UPI003BAD43BC